MTNPLPKSDSLAFALLGAAHAVTRVRGGTALPQALAHIFVQMEAPPQARGAIQDIAYTTMRRLGRAEALLSILARKPAEPPLLHGLLCCALALVSETNSDQNGPQYTEFTVVDQAVNAAAADDDTAAARNLVNAILRRFLREKITLLQQVSGNPVALWNYPAWWISAMRAAYPQQWEAILTLGNQAPPLVLRVNRRKTSVADYLALLEQKSMPARFLKADAILIEKPIPVAQLPGFEQGWVSVQDMAAQYAAPLLDVHDGMRVLDACAAPGGKSCHLLEIAQIDLTALDNDAQRLNRMNDNLARLQLSAEVRVGDASAHDWWDGRRFDRIIADVPCTASGIVRRHPDIRWLRRNQDRDRLATVSAQILDNLWQMLEPNGKLLFVTCSLWPQESEMQATAFAARHQALRLPAPGQLLPTANIHENHDGLFYALFQKVAP